MMKPMDRRRDGFTLIELMVVVLIIGILVAFAIPQYLSSVETSKADDATALMNMVATTNRMYALDHPGKYVTGSITNTCNNGAACLGDGSSPCELVRCKYLAAQDFDNKAYSVMACDPGASCTGASACAAAGAVACVQRMTTGAHAANYAPYSGWGYSVTPSGVITSVGGAPAAVSP